GSIVPERIRVEPARNALSRPPMWIEIRIADDIHAILPDPAERIVDAGSNAQRRAGLELQDAVGLPPSPHILQHPGLERRVYLIVERPCESRGAVEVRYAVVEIDLLIGMRIPIALEGSVRQDVKCFLPTETRKKGNVPRHPPFDAQHQRIVV